MHDSSPQYRVRYACPSQLCPFNCCETRLEIEERSKDPSPQESHEGGVAIQRYNEERTRDAYCYGSALGVGHLQIFDAPKWSH